MTKSILIFIILFCFAANLYAQDRNISAMKKITPVEYFASGNVSYYFGYDGIREFSFDKRIYKYKDIVSYNNLAYGKPSLNKLMDNVEEVYYMRDGSIMIPRLSDDYSCINNSGNNCLYAPIYIRKINKKSLSGRISLYRLDENIPLEEKDIINFPLDSYMYSIVIDVPAYDFSTFDDFASLVCIKNEENLCKGVINHGMIDKLALFELNRIAEDNKEFLYKDIGDGLIYGVDLVQEIITPYNKACFQAAKYIDDLEGCIESNLNKGHIKRHRHPNGITYWEMSFHNISVDNIIFWVNNRGEPFKVYTNNHFTYNFSLFNKKASELIKKKFLSNNSTNEK